MSSDAWKKENSVLFSFRLFKSKDKELIDWLNSVEGKTDYYRNLIVEDMKKNKKEEEAA